MRLSGSFHTLDTRPEHVLGTDGVEPSAPGSFWKATRRKTSGWNGSWLAAAYHTPPLMQVFADVAGRTIQVAGAGYGPARDMIVAAVRSEDTAPCKKRRAMTGGPGGVRARPPANCTSSCIDITRLRLAVRLELMVRCGDSAAFRDFGGEVGGM